jgi:tryptophanyl-tRNA synthetase
MADGQRKRILSGVQPSGKLHLGNYFGAIKQHIALQDEGECFYFIADYHALTTLGEAVRADAEVAKEQKRKPQKGADILRENVRDVALDYLALGLDPKKATFYRQSDVPEVTELAWILSTVTGMGLLERAHSYKDKLAKGIPPSVGLFTYPILMAADILIVRSNLVPVGQDQVQHLEMTRDMAGYFNQTFGVDLFPMPMERLDVGAKVPGTDGQKMSKSRRRVGDKTLPPNSIEIFAEGKPLKKSVMSIVTDSTPPEAPKDPETRIPYVLYKLVATPEEAADLAARYRAGGLGDGTAKQMLLEKIDLAFAPFRERRKQLAADSDYVEDVLRDGARRARAEAGKTMELVRDAVGLLGRPV